MFAVSNEKYKGTFRPNILDGYCQKTTTEKVLVNPYVGKKVDAEITTMGEIKKGFWY